MRTARFEPTPAWQHALDQPGCGRHLLLVTEAQGDVVGWCRLFPVHGNGCQPSGVGAEGAELGIGLLPAYRGQGAGQEMVESSLAWARQAGLPAVYLTTRRTNAVAIRLFARCGFVVDGRQGNGLVMMRCNLEGAHEAKQARGREQVEYGA